MRSRPALLALTLLAPLPLAEMGWWIYDKYQQALRYRGAVDFDDLIRLPVRLFESEADVLLRWQGKLQYLLVDEYQDTNAAQYELIRLLVTGPTSNRNIFVVGDEDQSIYKFRGADVRNISQLEETFPELTTIRSGSERTARHTGTTAERSCRYPERFCVR